ncbi:baseplate multidomain protein megatron [Mangrovicoccus algicola]|uniref:Glycoside hydrolase/phage tail family protein n=1 Tax=Mangrovicoccus algicola TaxID=2771008 RepID=A0A8J6Z890_9RHOB|nr:glycoside hydrolase/phage tail family protein [Mangrovicoccus algicola]MBE3639729.1 glycoside hydrolase/phage tail family protein [Mangrovicoccus algicola]
MATIVLGAVGAAAGASIGGSVLGLSAAVIGRAAGAVAGHLIDQRLLGAGSQAVETGRLDRLRLTSASEGTAIQQVYGRMRVPGQVIWSTRFKERRQTKKSGGGKGGAPATSVTSYSYSISLAIALCEGEIAGIDRIWADGKEIGRNKLDMAVYPGSQSQDPDPKIVAVEGLENAPAYRGVAYVVISDLELGPFGNRVPQFSFEVLRPAQQHSEGEVASMNRAIRGVALMPGSGEYTLATDVVHYDKGIGRAVPGNRNTPSGKSDFLISMDQLEAELPNCGSALLVASWFGDDLRCDRCELRPKVEQKRVGASRMPWEVSGLDRLAAQEVPLHDGRPVYGGTPADRSVMQAIAELKRRGKRVVFYPFILMEQMAGNGLVNPWWGGPEQPPLPWRGRITGSLAPGVAGSPDGSAAAAEEVAAFFGTAAPSDFAAGGGTVAYSGPAEWSYRRFILHYAHLCKAAGGIDAFVIGSEMRGLTQLRGADHRFPAVEQFCQLAEDVRQVLGTGTKLGYAADWSEYFGYSSPDGNRYFHLDPLWAHPDIDFIGIDNYMPLSDWRDSADHADAHWHSIHDIGYLQANIEGGEGYDWYYADAAGRDAQDRLPITDGAHNEPWIWRYKDIRAWWSLAHHERIGGVRQAQPTAWVPQSKPVWFTEFGCAAIDKGTNEPNKFLDPKSSESDIPHYSTGARDDLIQMQYLRAVQDYWEQAENNPVSAVYGGPMIDMSMAHVWAWDARPYPYFPGRMDVWGDGGNYTRGHWVNGRTSGRDLAEVVREICARSGVTGIGTQALRGYVRGYAVTSVDGARAALQPLMLAHGFDAVERDGTLSFRSRTGRPDLVLPEGALAEHPEQEGDLVQVRQSGAELAGRVQIAHLAADAAYEARSSGAAHPGDDPQSLSVSELNMALTFGEAQRMAERWLSEARVSRDTVSFALPPSYINVTAGDVVEIAEAAGPALYRIDRIEDFGIRLVEAVRVEPGVYIPGGGYEEGDPLAVPPPSALPFPVFLDLPLLTGAEDPYAPHLAVAADPWPGEVAVLSSGSDGNYGLNAVIGETATLGVTLSPLKRARPGLIDRGDPLTIDLAAGVLSGTDWASLLNGANALAIGDGQGGAWEIFQFLDHELDENGRAVIRNRLRGQQGTDAFIPDAWPAGSLVVLLDAALLQPTVPAIRGLARHYRIGAAEAPQHGPDYLHIVHAADAAGLRPWAPVRLEYRVLGGGAHRFSWLRRARVGGEDWSLPEVPLSEARELYRVTVRTADGALLREAETGNPQFDYSESQRAADGADGGYVLEVAQVSELYGPGPARRIEVNV